MKIGAQHWEDRQKVLRKSKIGYHTNYQCLWTGPNSTMIPIPQIVCLPKHLAFEGGVSTLRRQDGEYNSLLTQSTALFT